MVTRIAVFKAATMDFFGHLGAADQAVNPKWTYYLINLKIKSAFVHLLKFYFILLYYIYIIFLY